MSHVNGSSKSILNMRMMSSDRPMPNWVNETHDHIGPKPPALPPTSGQIQKQLPPPPLPKKSNHIEPDYEVIEFSNQQYSNAAPVRSNTPETKRTDGLKCQLCGSPNPWVSCDQCGNQIFCASCDDMFHKHPKRQSHVRKAMEKSQSIKPPLPPKTDLQFSAPVPPPRRNKKAFPSPLPVRRDQLGLQPQQNGTLKRTPISLSNRPLPETPTQTSSRSSTPNSKSVFDSIQKPPSITLEKIKNKASATLSKMALLQQRYRQHQESKAEGSKMNSTSQLNDQMSDWSIPSSPSRLRSGSMSSGMNMPNQRPSINGTFSNYPHQHHQMDSIQQIRPPMRTSASVFNLNQIGNQRQVPMKQVPWNNMAQAQSMAQINCAGCNHQGWNHCCGRDGWMDGSSQNLHGSNMSLNMPPGYYPPQPSMMGPPPTWFNNWNGPPNMYPYPYPMMNGMMTLPRPPRSRVGSRAGSPALSIKSRKSMMSSRHKRSSYVEHELTDDEDSEDDRRSIRSHRSELPGQRRRTHRKGSLTSQSFDDEIDDFPSTTKTRSKSRSTAPLSRDMNDKSNIHHKNTTSNEIVSGRKSSATFVKGRSERGSNSSKGKGFSDSPLTPDSENEPPTKALVQAKIQEKLSKEKAIQSNTKQTIEKSVPVSKGTGNKLIKPTQESEEEEDESEEERESEEDNKNDSNEKTIEEVPSLGPPPSTPDHDWECEFCTFVNEANVKICAVCCKTPIRPPVKPIQDNIKKNIPSSKKNEKPSTVKPNTLSTSKKNEKTSTKTSTSTSTAVPTLKTAASKKIDKKDMDNTSKQLNTSKISQSEDDSDQAYGAKKKAGTVINNNMSLDDIWATLEEDIKNAAEATKRNNERKLSSENESTNHQQKMKTSTACGPSPPREVNQKIKNNTSVSTGTSPPPQSISTQTYDVLPQQKLHAEQHIIDEPYFKSGRSYSIATPTQHVRENSDSPSLINNNENEVQSLPPTPPLRNMSPIGIRKYNNELNLMEPESLLSYNDRNQFQYYRDMPSSKMDQFRSTNDLRRDEPYLSRRPSIGDMLSYQKSHMNEPMLSQWDPYDIRRRDMKPRDAGSELVILLKEAEHYKFTAEELQAALKHCGDTHPILWLRENWSKLIKTVQTLATKYGQEQKENVIGTISSIEAREALRVHRGNVWHAVTECIEQRQKKYREIAARSNYSREDIVTALTAHHGNVELALIDLGKSQIKPFLMRIWGSPNGIENESGNLDFGQKPNKFDIDPSIHDFINANAESLQLLKMKEFRQQTHSPHQLCSQQLSKHPSKRDLGSISNLSIQSFGNRTEFSEGFESPSDAMSSNNPHLLKDIETLIANMEQNQAKQNENMLKNIENMLGGLLEYQNQQLQSDQIQKNNEDILDKNEMLDELQFTGEDIIFRKSPIPKLKLSKKLETESGSIEMNVKNFVSQHIQDIIPDLVEHVEKELEDTESIGDVENNDDFIEKINEIKSSELSNASYQTNEDSITPMSEINIKDFVSKHIKDIVPELVEQVRKELQHEVVINDISNIENELEVEGHPNEEIHVLYEDNLFDKFETENMKSTETDESIKAEQLENENNSVLIAETKHKKPDEAEDNMNLASVMKSEFIPSDIIPTSGTGEKNEESSTASAMEKTIYIPISTDEEISNTEMADIIENSESEEDYENPMISSVIENKQANQNEDILNLQNFTAYENEPIKTENTAISSNLPVSVSNEVEFTKPKIESENKSPDSDNPIIIIENLAIDNFIIEKGSTIKSTENVVPPLENILQTTENVSDKIEYSQTEKSNIVEEQSLKTNNIPTDKISSKIEESLDMGDTLKNSIQQNDRSDPEKILINNGHREEFEIFQKSYPKRMTNTDSLNTLVADQINIQNSYDTETTGENLLGSSSTNDLIITTQVDSYETGLISLGEPSNQSENENNDKKKTESNSNVTNSNDFENQLPHQKSFETEVETNEMNSNLSMKNEPTKYKFETNNETEDINFSTVLSSTFHEVNDTANISQSLSLIDNTRNETAFIKLPAEQPIKPTSVNQTETQQFQQKKSVSPEKNLVAPTSPSIPQNEQRRKTIDDLTLLNNETYVETTSTNTSIEEESTKQEAATIERVPDENLMFTESLDFDQKDKGTENNIKIQLNLSKTDILTESNTTEHKSSIQKSEINNIKQVKSKTGDLGIDNIAVHGELSVEKNPDLLQAEVTDTVSNVKNNELEEEVLPNKENPEQPKEKSDEISNEVNNNEITLSYNDVEIKGNVESVANKTQIYDKVTLNEKEKEDQTSQNNTLNFDLRINSNDNEKLPSINTASGIIELINNSIQTKKSYTQLEEVLHMDTINEEFKELPVQSKEESSQIEIHNILNSEVQINSSEPISINYIQPQSVESSPIVKTGFNIADQNVNVVKEGTPQMFVTNYDEENEEIYRDVEEPTEEEKFKNVIGDSTRQSKNNFENLKNFHDDTSDEELFSIQSDEGDDNTYNVQPKSEQVHPYPLENSISITSFASTDGFISPTMSSSEVILILNTGSGINRESAVISIEKDSDEENDHRTESKHENESQQAELFSNQQNSGEILIDFTEIDNSISQNPNVIDIVKPKIKDSSKQNLTELVEDTQRLIKQMKEEINFDIASFEEENDYSGSEIWTETDEDYDDENLSESDYEEEMGEEEYDGDEYDSEQFSETDDEFNEEFENNTEHELPLIALNPEDTKIADNLIINDKMESNLSPNELVAEMEHSNDATEEWSKDNDESEVLLENKAVENGIREDQPSIAPNIVTILDEQVLFADEGDNSQSLESENSQKSTETGQSDEENKSSPKLEMSKNLNNEQESNNKKQLELITDEPISVPKKVLVIETKKNVEISEPKTTKKIIDDQLEPSSSKDASQNLETSENSSIEIENSKSKKNSESKVKSESDSDSSSEKIQNSEKIEKTVSKLSSTELPVSIAKKLELNSVANNTAAVANNNLKINEKVTESPSSTEIMKTNVKGVTDKNNEIKTEISKKSSQVKSSTGAISKIPKLTNDRGRSKSFPSPPMITSVKKIQLELFSKQQESSKAIKPSKISPPKIVRKNSISETITKLMAPKQSPLDILKRTPHSSASISELMKVDSKIPKIPKKKYHETCFSDENPSSSSEDESHIMEERLRRKQSEPVFRTYPSLLQDSQTEPAEVMAKKFVEDGLCDNYMEAELAAALVELKFQQESALWAAKECCDLEQAISLLQQECELCTGLYPMNQIVSMLKCTHTCCKDCAKNYFTIQITDRSINDCNCPYCKVPELHVSEANEDEILEYFSNLDIFLKTILDREVHELFQRKLRDRSLMQDPNFKWCVKCSSGFFARPKQKRLICPDCGSITCALCRKPWEKQHEGLSCNKYQEWLDSNDPDKNIQGVLQHLATNGIDCPKCKFRFSLARGGCMHFTCTQCKYEFCYGCGRPFMMGAKCTVSSYCARLGLHSHHPRNCLFYLRDKEPHQLQNLLKMHQISFDEDPQIEKTDKKNKQTLKCPVPLQKETPTGLIDTICNGNVPEKYAGLCRQHYVEYLVSEVSKANIDPLPILDLTDCVQELRRRGIALPERGPWDTDEIYRGMCSKIVEAQIPLN